MEPSYSQIPDNPSFVTRAIGLETCIENSRKREVPTGYIKDDSTLRFHTALERRAGRNQD
jgi:hypothetical protein